MTKEERPKLLHVSLKELLHPKMDEDLVLLASLWRREQFLTERGVLDTDGIFFEGFEVGCLLVCQVFRNSASRNGCRKPQAVAVFGPIK